MARTTRKVVVVFINLWFSGFVGQFEGGGKFKAETLRGGCQAAYEVESAKRFAEQPPSLF